MNFVEFVVLKPLECDGLQADPGDIVTLESTAETRKLCDDGYLKPNLGEIVRYAKGIFDSTPEDHVEDPDTYGWNT